MQTITFSDEYLQDKFSAEFLLKSMDKVDNGTINLSGSERYVYEELYNLGKGGRADLRVRIFKFHPELIPIEDNTEDILLGIKSPFNHLPVPDQPATYPSIYSTNNMSREISPLNNMPEGVDNKPLTPDESFNKEGQPVFDQERLNSQLNLIDDLSPDKLQKIYDQTGNVYYRSSPESTLTPIQHEIVGEISRIFSEFGAQSDLLAIVGSWGDTLPESEILQLFRQFKVSVHETVIDDIVKDAHDSMQG